MIYKKRSQKRRYQSQKLMNMTKILRRILLRSLKTQPKRSQMTTIAITPIERVLLIKTRTKRIQPRSQKQAKTNLKSSLSYSQRKTYEPGKYEEDLRSYH